MHFERTALGTRGESTSPGNPSKSIPIVAGELLEYFQWNFEAQPERVQDELADALTYWLHLVKRLGVDTIREGRGSAWILDTGGSDLLKSRRAEDLGQTSYLRPTD